MSIWPVIYLLLGLVIRASHCWSLHDLQLQVLCPSSKCPLNNWV